MHPGQACIKCHTKKGPKFSIAGTVYPTAHEPDDCYGLGSSTVVITDATGKVLTLKSNSAGNFYSQTAIKMPYTAKVIVGTKERAMKDSQTNGDCNSCHTVTGAEKAPGRIMAP